MMQEPLRRAAMERDAASGEAVLSPKLRLAGLDGPRAGFIVYLASLRAGQARGWLTAAFRAEEFMHGLIGERHAPLVRSEEHTSELQSLMRISYAVFCLKKKKKNRDRHTKTTYRKTPINSSIKSYTDNRIHHIY